MAELNITIDGSKIEMNYKEITKEHTEALIKVLTLHLKEYKEDSKEESNDEAEQKK